MPGVLAVVFQPLASAIPVRTTGLWTRNAGSLVLVHRLPVLRQIRAVCISVPTKSTGKRLVVCVSALVRRQSRLDREGLVASWKVADKGLATGVRCQMVGQLLVGHAAVATN